MFFGEPNEPKKEKLKRKTQIFQKLACCLLIFLLILLLNHSLRFSNKDVSQSLVLKAVIVDQLSVTAANQTFVESAENLLK
jgi:hypothetical protein